MAGRGRRVLNLKRFKPAKYCNLMKKAGPETTFGVVHSRNAKNVQTSWEGWESRGWEQVPGEKQENKSRFNFV